MKLNLHLFAAVLATCFAASSQNIYAEYCTDFSTSTRSYGDRSLNSITFGSFDGEEEISTTITVNQSSASGAVTYFNLTAYSVESAAGESITTTPNWTGSWMNGYLYIDYNNDGVFDTTVNADGTTGGELVSYSYYLDENSLGESVSGGNGPKPPTFTLPSNIAAGEYNARFAIDWDNIDPCEVGSYANAPATVDFKIKILEGESRYNVTINNISDQEWELEWMDDFDRERIEEAFWSKTYERQGGNADWSLNMSTYDGCFDFDDDNIILKGIVNPGEDITNDDRDYLCGGIYGAGKKLFMRGKLEIRAKCTSATGAWPAVWLMPQDQSAGWPGCGEIDLLEHLNYENNIYQTLHTNYTYNVSKTDPVSAATPWVDASEYNTYGVILAEDKLQVLLNGDVTIDYPNLGITEPYVQFPFDKEYYLIMDMQLGGSWVGSVTGADLPVELCIDWVKWYLPVPKGGTVALYNGDTEVESGDRVSNGETLNIEVTLNEGFEIATLTVNGVDIKESYLADNGYSFEVSDNIEIEATYAAITPSITYSIEGENSISIEDIEGASIASESEVEYNTQVVINFSDDDMDNLVSYTVNGVDRVGFIANNCDVITATENCEINIVLNNQSGIESADAAFSNAYANSEGIVVNVSTASDITLYSINGTIIYKGRVADSINIPAEGGIYIVKVGEKFFKVSKK